MYDSQCQPQSADSNKTHGALRWNRYFLGGFLYFGKQLKRNPVTNLFFSTLFTAWKSFQFSTCCKPLSLHSWVLFNFPHPAKRCKESSKGPENQSEEKEDRMWHQCRRVPVATKWKLPQVERSHTLTLPSAQKPSGGNSTREMDKVDRSGCSKHAVQHTSKQGLGQVLQQRTAAGAASFFLHFKEAPFSERPGFISDGKVS